MNQQIYVPMLGGVRQAIEKLGDRRDVSPSAILLSAKILPLESPASARLIFSCKTSNSHFPGLAKLDLRVEAPLANTVSKNAPGKYIYWDSFYHDLYTNRGFLMGNWVGRDGAGIQASSRYWLNGRNAIQFGYRHAKVDPQFVPNGGTINDASARFDFWLLRDWSASAFVQYEQWKFSLLAPSLQKNVSSSVQFTYWPHFPAH